MFQTYPAGLCSAKRFIWTFEEHNIFAHPTDYLQQPVKIQILRCFCAIWLADQSFISQPAPLQETQNRFCPPGILSIFLQMHFTCWVFTKHYWALTWRMFQHLLSIQRQEDWTDMKENGLISLFFDWFQNEFLGQRPPIWVHCRRDWAGEQPWIHQKEWKLVAGRIKEIPLNWFLCKVYNVPAIDS